MDRKYPPIADYALIGDCRTAALISRSGSIDWYCPGRFDAPAILCRLLDADKGGYLAICCPTTRNPAGRPSAATSPTPTCWRRPSTMATPACASPITCRCRAGGAGMGTEIHRGIQDRSPHRGRVRRDGRVHPLQAHLALRQGRSELPKGRSLLACCGDEQIGLSCPGATLHQVDDTTWDARLHVREGECRNAVLLACPGKDATAKALQERSEDDGFDRTKSFWEEWAGKCTYKGPYRETVLRSALVLKLLTYDQQARWSAAPTTSLPRNRRRAKLGLPLHLAARLQPDPLCPDHVGYQEEAVTLSGGCGA